MAELGVEQEGQNSTWLVIGPFAAALKRLWRPRRLGTMLSHGLRRVTRSAYTRRASKRVRRTARAKARQGIGRLSVLRANGFWCANAAWYSRSAFKREHAM